METIKEFINKLKDMAIDENTLFFIESDEDGLRNPVNKVEKDNEKNILISYIRNDAKKESITVMNLIKKLQKFEENEDLYYKKMVSSSDTRAYLPLKYELRYDKHENIVICKIPFTMNWI